MLPPGLSFNAVNEKALYRQQSRHAFARILNWEEMLASNQTFFPTRRPPFALTCAGRSPCWRKA
jgi:hypothetical protein